MTEPDSPVNAMQHKVRQQVDRITEAFSAREVNLVTEEAAGGVDFMCHDSQILVRDDHLERVQRILGQPPGRAQVTPVIQGVVVLTLGPASVHSDELRVAPGEQPTVSAALDTIGQVLAEGIATPDHVLTVCAGVVSPCPATEPRVVEDGIEPHPGLCTGNSGEGVLIYIADTGLLEDVESGHPWLAGVQRARKPDGTWQEWDSLVIDPDHKPMIPVYTGHGTFVAGVARCIAPRADVIVSNVFKDAGSALESEFILELTRALKLGVDIFNLSVTAPTRHSLPLIAFERWLGLLEQYKGVICVAAAGNSNVRAPSWPAAFTQLVSVGALTADGRDRADFSNYGGWVDVYAPGRDIINAYATGTYTYHDDPYTGEQARFLGMARWSGTSFSTPIVTGLIAARMSRTGENAKDAAAALLREAQYQAIPGVGAVLLPWDSKDND